ncbi:hypothetical protein CRUP_015256 [Coryphaenoides rupestris]|nr:hypothetical protein CRUP_015256 [Coryphaenoides rupestris]
MVHRAFDPGAAWLLAFLGFGSAGGAPQGRPPGLPDSTHLRTHIVATVARRAHWTRSSSPENQALSWARPPAAFHMCQSRRASHGPTIRGAALTLPILYIQSISWVSRENWFKFLNQQKEFEYDKCDCDLYKTKHYKPRSIN